MELRNGLRESIPGVAPANQTEESEVRELSGKESGICSGISFLGGFVYTIGAKMITCRKNCFEQLIFELHRITVHLLSFARINFRL